LAGGGFGVALGVGLAAGFFDPAAEPFFEGFEHSVIEDAKWLRDGGEGCSIETVDVPVRSGEFSVRFRNSAGARCELVPWVGSNVLGRLIREPFHVDRWYAFSVYLPEDWQEDEQNEVIAQWHSSKDVFFGEVGGRGPPLAFRIVQSNWSITYGFDPDLLSDAGAKAGNLAWQGPIAPGEWTDWVLHVRWSHEADGITRVWQNGELVVDRKGPNAYNDLRGVYLKIGNYHPGQDRVVYIDEVRIDGPDATYASVAPRPPRADVRSATTGGPVDPGLGFRKSRVVGVER
jgi:hypothetical protein